MLSPGYNPAVDDFASARAVIRDALSALLPPARLSVADFAAEHRYLANLGGGYVGRWDHAEAPYLVGPMEALTDPAYDAVAVVGPGQTGKTAVAENWLLQAVESDPGSFLWYMQTDTAMDAYVKDVIDPMIKTHAGLQSRLGPRPIDNTLSYKRFDGMSVQFLAANRSNLISKKAPRVILDEIDAYDAGLGDVKAMADVRRSTFGALSKLLAVSHPDRATGLDPEHDWLAGIMALYAVSTRFLWYWPCPHCEGYSSPNPTARRFMGVAYDSRAPLDEIRQSAVLSCPCCGADIEDRHRKAMNQAGRWIGRGQEIAEDGTVTGDLRAYEIAGYWIVGPMSTLTRGGIGKMAADKVAAERALELTGEDDTVRSVYAKQWGIPYTPPKTAADIDVEALVERAMASEDRLGQVPADVRYLTAAVDVQGTWFEVLVRGWTATAESVVIDRYKITVNRSDPDANGEPRPIDPARRIEDWALIRTYVLDRLYPLAADPGRAMGIRATVIDSGGQPGVTHNAYAVWRAWRQPDPANGNRRTAIRHGRSREGHEMWSVLLTKGQSSLHAPKLRQSYPDAQRKDRKVAALGTICLGGYNASLFKDDLAAQLSRGERAGGHVRFARELVSLDPATGTVAKVQDFFGQFAGEKREKTGEWVKTGRARNEVIDLMVLTDVARRFWSGQLIDWATPPSWAVEQDRNPLVVAVDDRAEALPQPDDAPAGDETKPALMAKPETVDPAERGRRLAQLMGQA